MTDDELERVLRNTYGALGPGFPREASRLFDQGGAEGAEWCVKVYGRRLRCLSASELQSTDLFALPPAWEVMRAEVLRLTCKRGFAAVTGFMYCRPKGSWESMRLPLMHVWTMCLDKAMRFENLLDDFELCRADGRTSCLAQDAAA